MKSYAVLVAIVAIAKLLATRYSQADYGRINKYLVAQVKNNEVGPNLKAALGWLEESMNKPKTQVVLVPISDLKRLTALQQVIDDTNCDGSVDWIINANSRAVQARYVLNSYERVPVRRVDEIILKIIQDYAKRCEKVHQDEYLRRRSKLDKHVEEQVDSIAKIIMSKNQVGWQDYRFNPEADQQYVKDYSVWKSIDRYIFRAALVHNAKGNPDAEHLREYSDQLAEDKKAAQVDLIRNLTRKYLIRPCGSFVDALGPGMFIPEINSIRSFEADPGRKYLSFLSDADYYSTWFKFTICRAIVKDDQTVLYDVIKSFQERKQQ